MKGKSPTAGRNEPLKNESTKPRASSATPKPAPKPLAKGTWTIDQELAGGPLDAALRALSASSWNVARDAIRTGKVSVDGEVVTEIIAPVRRGETIVLDPKAPRPRTRAVMQLAEEALVHLDGAVVVVRKPSGISTIPFGDEAPGQELMTLDALVREVVARKTSFRGRAPLGIVHRLDKDTSGLLVFTRTVDAKKHLTQQFRDHTVFREYVAVVHGHLERETTYRTHLVQDRGDGLRGSAQRGRRDGQLAITHVKPIRPLSGATLVACRLETGRTHQIRIHLSEAGHPLVGEVVYTRRFRGPQIPAARTMLHARALGFVHPISEEEMRFEDDPPEDFREVVARLELAPAARQGVWGRGDAGESAPASAPTRPTQPARPRINRPRRPPTRSG
jgi:23S rRNA pseudouridine1911/1915/1917 synthase